MSSPDKTWALPADQAVVNGTASVSALRASVPSAIETLAVSYDPACPAFGIDGSPKPHDQHPNQRKGLDLYVSVVNFQTGEWCFKKLYENKRGLHFKHTGYSPMYLDDFTAVGFIIPFQVFTAQGLEAGTGETERLDPTGESPVAEADAPNQEPQP